jgi:hypothetical protein
MRTRLLVYAGMLAGLAALLQTTPVWLGEPQGYLLAILACLPIAVAALVDPKAAAYALVTATLLCLLVKPQEAWVFAFTNGPLGLAVGIAVGAGRPYWMSAGVGGVVLGLGMALLTWGAGVAAMGPGTLAWDTRILVLVYFAFALVWSAGWTGAVRLIHRRLAPIITRFRAHITRP